MALYTSEQVKQRIVNMKITLQMKYIDIHRNLASEGINVSTHTISKVCSNYIKHNIIARKGYGGGSSKITKEIKDFIDKRYTENDELTAKDLAIAIEDKFKVTVCNDTIRKNRRALGWVKTGPRYAQLVRFANRTKQPFRE